MKTPKKYSDNLKKRIINQDMLRDCLFSVNKRAKNYRDKQSMYRYIRQNNRFFIDKHDCETKCREMKEEYYSFKERLLEIVDPVCIHREHVIDRCGCNAVNYYLYYEIKDRSFHSPIDYYTAKNMGLPIVDIDTLDTHGNEITDLVSVQFVRKVLDLIDSGNYQYVA